MCVHVKSSKLYLSVVVVIMYKYLLSRIFNKYVKISIILLGVLLLASANGQKVEAQNRFVPLETLENKGTVRGVIRPNSEAVLATDISARVKKITFKNGQHFNKGDLLIAFDCSRYNAQLMGAEAEFRAQNITYKSNNRLLKHRAVGSNEVAIAKAARDKALAGVRELKALVSMCKIYAPYDGHVVERKINEHEYSGPNVPLMKILDSSELEINLIVPSNWLNWLTKGTAFKFSVDETGVEYAATVKRIGAEVDPVSQTVNIMGSFDKLPKNVLSGMSGTARFSKNSKAALLQ